MQKKPNRPTYQPPRIESVLTSEEIEREALYAGIQSPNPDTLN